MSKPIIAFGAIGCASIACAHEHGAGTVVARAAGERNAIESVVANVAYHIDGRDWVALRKVQRQASADLMDAWKTLLTPVVTQHHLGPIAVIVSGGRRLRRCCGGCLHPRAH